MNSFSIVNHSVHPIPSQTMQYLSPVVDEAKPDKVDKNVKTKKNKKRREHGRRRARHISDKEAQLKQVSHRSTFSPILLGNRITNFCFLNSFKSFVD